MLSTFNRYIPGVGRTITQANIAAVNAERTKQQQPLIMGAEAMARELIGKENLVETRHIARASRLMHGGA